MKRNFHPGDRVRYLGGGSRNKDKLVFGKVYTVAERTIEHGGINELILDEVEAMYSPHGWYFDDTNFEVVEKASQPGDVNDDYDRAMGIIC